MANYRRSPARSSARAPGPESSILKIRGSEIHAGGRRARDGGDGPRTRSPGSTSRRGARSTSSGSPSTSTTCARRRSTAARNEIQKNIIAKQHPAPAGRVRRASSHGFRSHATSSGSSSTRVATSSRRTRRSSASASCATSSRGWSQGRSGRRWASSAGSALPFPEAAGGFGGRFVDAALILEQLGTTLVPEPFIPSVVLGGMALSQAGDAGAAASAGSRR